MKIEVTRDWLTAVAALEGNLECGVGYLYIPQTKEDINMSYSFNVRAATKALALNAVEVELDKVAASMPEHKRDVSAHLEAAVKQVAMLSDSDDHDVMVTCNGYLSWTGSLADDTLKVISASMSCTASLASRAVAPQGQQVVGAARLA